MVSDCQQRMDFPDGFFDRYLAIHVLEHLPNLPGAVREAWRLLNKERGRMLVVIPTEGSPLTASPARSGRAPLGPPLRRPLRRVLQTRAHQCRARESWKSCSPISRSRPGPSSRWGPVHVLQSLYRTLSLPSPATDAHRRTHRVKSPQRGASTNGAISWAVTLVWQLASTTTNSAAATSALASPGPRRRRPCQRRPNQYPRAERRGRSAAQVGDAPRFPGLRALCGNLRHPEAADVVPILSVPRAYRRRPARLKVGMSLFGLALRAQTRSVASRAEEVVDPIGTRELAVINPGLQSKAVLDDAPVRPSRRYSSCRRT